METDTTRYKQTGYHVVYDAGGPADGTPGGGRLEHRRSPCKHGGDQSGADEPAGSGRYYCADADCTGRTGTTSVPGGSATRPDASIRRGSRPKAGRASSGNTSSSSLVRALRCQDENGGIHGEVIYASTRPFDDPALLIHTSWTPDVPGVTINLYQEGTAADGTTSLTLVDTTMTTSWDDWAQGFRSDWQSRT